MRCPKCKDEVIRKAAERHSENTGIIDSRASTDGWETRRRWQCQCGHRFTTHERIEPEAATSPVVGRILAQSLVTTIADLVRVRQLQEQMEPPSPIATEAQRQQTRAQRWEAVDWNKTNAEIAAEVGASSERVRQVRKEKFDTWGIDPKPWDYEQRLRERDAKRRAANARAATTETF